ncbi:hypothetical protein SAY86_000331 [Trapa natans]|uniref:Uncharacterized protein n=1 Tax=Trapa natans TaxID=22666 RepID=A0AAN7RMS9_TRANT|nr:hypothetical protein SAY86_000331 [Trapa natans]
MFELKKISKPGVQQERANPSFGGGEGWTPNIGGSTKSIRTDRPISDHDEQAQAQHTTDSLCHKWLEEYGSHQVGKLERRNNNLTFLLTK